MMTPDDTTPFQYQLDLDSRFYDRFKTLREFLAYLVYMQPKLQKAIAADMDISPSALTRKLNPGENDSQRFNVYYLEGFLKSCPNAAEDVAGFIVSKFCDNRESKKQRLLNLLEKHMHQSDFLSQQMQELLNEK